MTSQAHKMGDRPYPTTESAGTTDRDAVFRDYIADLITPYITEQGKVGITTAYRQVSEVTHRTLSTVKNWLSYRTTLVDAASLARIVKHWHIPAEAVFPPHLAADPSFFDLQPGDQSARSAIAGFDGADDLVVPLFYPSLTKLEKAFAKYSESPRSMIWVRYDGPEWPNVIRTGELMAVDPTCEQIRGSGRYLLRVSIPGQADAICLRKVDFMLGQAAVRLSDGSDESSYETLPLQDGNLPPNITVLAKVTAVVRQS